MDKYWKWLQVKAGCMEGERVDGTPFNDTLEQEIKQSLLDNGFEAAGCESLYNGVTGEELKRKYLLVRCCR